MSRRVHPHGCIMGNQSERAENLKMCIGIQSQHNFPAFIYFAPLKVAFLLDRLLFSDLHNFRASQNKNLK